jgi:ATP-dependent Lon protease
MKDYMASGSFARGQDAVNAEASIAFIGNINDPVETLLKVSHLFSPFPEEFNSDSAFFDRIHYYLPGWEVPKMRTELLTEKYGLITDCLSEFCREMRKRDFSHLFDGHFELNGDFNKRDEIAARKTFSGLAKLLYPDANMTEEEMRALLEYAIEGRRRVKEQLKTMAGVEFIDVNLGYVDANGKEVIVEVPEQPTTTLIPAGQLPAGHVHGVGVSFFSGETCLYRLENKVVNGSGKLEIQGVAYGQKPVRESLEAAFVFFQNNVKKLEPSARINALNYLLYYADPQGQGRSAAVSVAEFVGLCSALMDKPALPSMAIAGDIKLSGTLAEISNPEALFRVSKNAGASKLLLPTDCIQSLQKVPRELLDAVQPVFYSDAIDAARKALALG